MGEFANLYINGCEVDSWKNSIGEGSYLFSEEDITQTPRAYRGGDESAEGYYEEDEDEEGQNGEGEGEESWRGYQYRNSAKNIIDRLEVMGFNLERARKWFDRGVAKEIGHAKEFQTMSLAEGGGNYPDFPLSPLHPEAIKYLEGYTFERWSGLMKEVFDAEADLSKEDPYLLHILERGRGSQFGFFGHGGMHMYRAMLEVVHPEAPVVLDFSYLVGWVGQDDYLCNPPTTVIMTEGSSDKRILEGTLRVLYPHLLPYYKFIDFDLANMPGSTGHLLTIVKAFIATGVQHRTVAVFDNDAAGHDALRQLSGLPMPDSIKAITLPHLPLAARYPTVGPLGLVETDINGLACSIELYLGRDVLEDQAGNLTPVQWRGLLPGVQKYQGEITNKGAIQDRYFRLLSEAGTRPELMESHDWGGMRLVLQSIFDLFKDQPVYEYEL